MDVHGVVDHVGLAEEIDLRLENLIIRVELFLLQKLQKGENQMAVQMGSNLRCQVVFRHSWCFFFLARITVEREYIQSTKRMCFRVKVSPDLSLSTLSRNQTVLPLSPSKLYRAETLISVKAISNRASPYLRQSYIEPNRATLISVKSYISLILLSPTDPSCCVGETEKPNDFLISTK